MKKIIYILALVGIATISCEPLEDTYDELDAITNSDFSADVVVTLTEDDYEEIANDDVANNKGFNDLDQAKEFLPAFLADKYPALGKSSTAVVNYGYFRGFPAAVIPFDESYTVTDEDYEAQGGSVAQFGNFSSFAQIVTFLDAKYDPSPADGFLLELNYDFFNGSVNDLTGYFRYNGTTWTEESFELNERYTVQDADYDAQGGTVAQFNNFSNQDQINTFLNSRYTNAVRNTVVKLTYDFFSGGVSELTKVFQFDGVATWTLKDGELISRDDYEAMGENFPNFSNQEEAENKLPIYLKNTFDPFAVAGDTYEFIYEVFNSSLSGSNRTEYTYAYLEYNGDKWILSRDVIPTSLSFAHNGQIWVPDNTINYTFTNDDYDAVVDAFTGNPDYENQVGNLDNFGNFNRTGSNSSWSDDQMLAAVNAVLLNNYPDAEVDQKFNVSYNTFNSGLVVETLSVILDANGEYVLNTNG